jgi:hypothetical protein
MIWRMGPAGSGVHTVGLLQAASERRQTGGALNGGALSTALYLPISTVCPHHPMALQDLNR